MTKTNGRKRTDAASRVIQVSLQTIYQAFLDPAAFALWRPPEGMKCQIQAFAPGRTELFKCHSVY